MEHIRGFSPEAPFNAYGSVVALKTEEISLDIGGKAESRLALFAQVDALDPLIQLNRAGQKLYTSIEIAPNFANTGKAYLVGLAVTDSPASLGTEMLQFSAQQGDKSPLANRKQDAANLFSAAEETAIELDEGGTTNADPTGIFASIKGLLDRFTPGGAGGQPPVQPPAAVTPPAAPEASQGGDLVALGAALGQIAAAVQEQGTASRDQFAALTAELNTLKTKVDTAPVSPFTPRAPATGGNAAAVRTDC